MRKQFNLQDWLKDKSQKVETRDGRPVKIISFEMTDTNDCPIAAQFRLCAGTPVVYLFDKEGHYKGEGDSDYDLFLVTPEPELTDFEIRLLDWLSNDTSGEIPMERMKELSRNRAKELLSLARKQLQPEIDAEIENAYKTADEVQYRKGREEVLRDMPRWKRDDSIEAEQHITVGKNGERFHYKGHSLLISDLTKLPGFKED